MEPVQKSTIQSRYPNLSPEKKIPLLFLINSVTNKKIQPLLKEVCSTILLMNKSMSLELKYLLESRKKLEVLNRRLKDWQESAPNTADTHSVHKSDNTKEKRVLNNAVARIEMAIDFLNKKVGERRDIENKKSFESLPLPVLKKIFSFFRFNVGKCAEEFDALKTICRIESTKLYPKFLGLESSFSIVDLFLKQVESSREPYRFIEENPLIPGGFTVRPAIQFFVPSDIKFIKPKHYLTSPVNPTAGLNLQHMSSLKLESVPDLTVEEIFSKVKNLSDSAKFPEAERFLVRILKDQEKKLKVIAAQQEELGNQHPDYSEALSCYIKTLTCLADVYNDMGYDQESENLYNRCLTLGEEVFANNSFLVTILNNLGSINLSLGKTHDALSYHERAKKVQEHVNLNHYDYFLCLRKIANCYLHQNKFKEAIDLYEKVLGVLKKELGEKDPASIHILSSLASAYASIGDRKKSVEYCDKYFKLGSEIYADKVYLGDILCSTAVNMTRIEKFKEALPLCKRALKIQIVLLGVDHPTTLSTMNQLGNIYSSLSKYTKAVSYYKLFSALQIQVLGEKHPASIKTLSSLAALYKMMGKLNESEELYLKCLSIGENILTEAKDPHLKFIYNNYGSLVRAMGNHEKALKLYERAVKYHHELGLDPCLLENLCTRNNIASIYSSLGQFDRALKLHLELLELKKLANGNEPTLSISKTLNNIGVVYQSIGNLDMALEYFSKSKEIVEKICDGDHFEMIQPLQNQAQIKKLKKNYSGAESDYLQALKISIKLFGEDHTTTATAMDAYSGICFIMKNYMKAFEYAEKALKIRKNKLGDKHPDTAASLHTLGDFNQSLGHLEKAVSYYEEALGIRTTLFPPNHPDISTTRNNLAVVYHSLGQYQKSLSLHETTLKHTIEIFGADHLNVAITNCNLASLYKSAKSYQKSLEHFEEAHRIRKIKEPNHPSTVGTLMEMAFLNSQLKQFEKAKDIYEETKKFVEKTKEELLKSPSTEEKRQRIEAYDGTIKVLDTYVNFCIAQLDKTQNRTLDSCSKELGKKDL